jgi:hypothetical protein
MSERKEFAETGGEERRRLELAAGLREVAVISWLSKPTSEAAPSPILLGMPGQPLAPQLLRRWQGRRFETLTMCTGSTDVDERHMPLSIHRLASRHQSPVWR